MLGLGRRGQYIPPGSDPTRARLPYPRRNPFATLAGILGVTLLIGLCLAVYVTMVKPGQKTPAEAATEPPETAATVAEENVAPKTAGLGAQLADMLGGDDSEPAGEQLADMLSPPPQEPPEDAIIYTVRGGDTLGHIAVTYETTWQRIAEMNGISNPNMIRPGQELIIVPGTHPRATPAAPPEPAISSRIPERVQ